MAQLEAITITLSMNVGDTELHRDLVSFELPQRPLALASTDGTARFAIEVNRTELRAQLALSTRLLADRIEDPAVVPLARGSVLLTCTDCNAELASPTGGALHHDAEGGHLFVPEPPQHPVSGSDFSNPSENPASPVGGGQTEGELSSLPDTQNGGRTCACADRGYEPTDVFSATQHSIDAASHLDAKGKDAGAIAALLALANKIENSDVILERVLRQIREDPESKIRPPAVDNVSLSTYLKYCISMGLTPGGRGELLPDANPATTAPDELADFRM